MRYFLVLFLLLGACAKKSDDGCHAPDEPTYANRLIVFGDSQTHGMAEPIDHCAYDWALVVARKQRLTLMNTAVAGSTFTSDSEYGQLMNLDYQSTDNIGMLIGFNDMALYGNDPAHLALFKERLTTALTHVSPLVSKIVIGTCLHPFGYINGQATPANIELYRQATKDVVLTLGLHNVKVIDVDGQFAGIAEYYVPDQWHIDNKAQDLVANAFITPLEEL